MRLRKSQKGSWGNVISRYLTDGESIPVKKAREIMRDALEYAASHSPQATGTFASNWRLSIGAPKPGTTTHDDSHLTGDRIEWNRKMGMPHLANSVWKFEGNVEAINKALNSPGSRLSALRLGQKVYLSTSATNSTTGEKYDWDVEDGTIKFRDVNPSAKHWGGKIAHMTSIYIRRKYSGAVK